MSVALELCGRTLAYRPIVATTPDGVRIAVQDHHRPAHTGSKRDVLFVHGFSQSSLVWLQQVTGGLSERHRLVTYDLRGHGTSDKPDDTDRYRDPDRWAEEVRTVIEAAGLVRPVLICWSYGGRVGLDYLRRFGCGGLSSGGVDPKVAFAKLRSLADGAALASRKYWP